MDVPFALSLPPVINLSKWGTWWHTGSQALPEKPGGRGGAQGCLGSVLGSSRHTVACRNSTAPAPY